MCKGSSFYELHKLLESQYEEILSYADRVAEYMRTMNEIPPLTLDDISSYSFIEEENNIQDLNMRDMISILMNDFDKIARIVNDIPNDNRSLANILDDLHEYMSKQKWFMRSYLQ